MEHPGLYSITSEPLWRRILVKPVFFALFPVLIPVRIILTVLLLGISALIDLILNINTDQNAPLPIIRRRIYKLQKFILYRCCLFINGFIVINKTIHCKQLLHTNEITEYSALICNYTSILDIIVGASCGIESVIVKPSIAKLWFLRPTIKVTRSIYSQRHDSFQQVQKRIHNNNINEQQQYLQDQQQFTLVNNINRKIRLPKIRIQHFNELVNHYKAQQFDSNNTIIQTQPINDNNFVYKQHLKYNYIYRIGNIINLLSYKQYKSINANLCTKAQNRNYYYPPLALFPSVIPSNQHLLLRFKPGVFTEGVNIKIMTIQYQGYSDIFLQHHSMFKSIWAILTNTISIINVNLMKDIITKANTESTQNFADRAGRIMSQQLVHGRYTEYDYKDILWFFGHNEYESQLSQRYRNEQLWRGQYSDWCKLCTSLGLNGKYNYTKDQLQQKQQQKKLRKQ